ncbi:Tetratricopeptide repeat protein 16, partial [Galemys pyrenaicus]
DSLELDQTPSHHIKKPWVIPAPERNPECIFGTSKVFQNFDDIKPKATGLTVPVKVREYYHRGQQCLEQSDWEMAVLFFSRALQLDSRLIDFYALRAEAYIQLCDFSSAAQNLRRAHSFQPENMAYLERLTWVLYLQGQCLFEQRAFIDALSVFSQASELQADNACFRYRCMACLLALNRHRECLALTSKEVKSGTSNADVYILRARLYNHFQKPNLCYRDLHRALLLDPTHPKAKALLKMMVGQAQEARQEAGILAVQGKLRYALKRINCAIENNPLDPSFFLFRGTVYRQLGEFDTAVEDFLKALDMASESQGEVVQQAQRQLLLAYNDFAVHCYRQGAYQESVLLLNKALRDEQGEKGLYINRGDCFFQMGNLAFAEADYKQALALSPQDEGANLRMGLLQERKGFCEQKGRCARAAGGAWVKFDKAEYHFSKAIQHNPQKPQYYLYRAKVRHLLQNIFGARQDVVTVLLLDPKHPKLPPMLLSLFPGMSVKAVLSSQLAHLAKLQLDRMMENFLKTDVSPGLVGQLRERELERQKARSLWQQEEPSQGTSEEQETAAENLQTESEHPEEDTPAPGEEQELPDLFRLQLGLTVSLSETETSTLCQEYRSTSATIVTLSDSSLFKSRSSDLGNWEDQNLIGSPRKNKATQDQSWSPSKTEAAQGQSWSPSKTQAAQGQSRSPSKTEAAQGQSRSPSKTQAAQGQSRSPSKTEAAQGQGRSPSKTEAAQGQGRSPSKTEAAQGQGRSPSKTEVAQGQSWSPSKTEAAQGQGRSPSKTEAAQGQGRSPSKTEAAQGQRPSKTQATQGQSQSLNKTEAAQGQGQGRSPSKTQAAQSRRPSKMEADQGRSPSKTQAAQSRRPSKMEADQGRSPSKTQADQDQSPSKTQATQGKIRRFHKTQGSKQRFRKAKVARTRGSGWGLIRSSSKTKAFGDSSQSPSNTELAQGQYQGPSKATDALPHSWSSSPDSSNNEATQDLSQNASRIKANQDSSLSSYTSV